MQLNSKSWKRLNIMIEIRYTANKQQLQICCDNSSLLTIREYFSVANPAFQRNQRFSQARIYALTPSGKFELGLLDHIKTYLIEHSINFKVESDVEADFNNGFQNPQIVKYKDLPYREHQEKSIFN